MAEFELGMANDRLFDWSMDEGAPGQVKDRHRRVCDSMTRASSGRLILLLTTVVACEGQPKGLRLKATSSREVQVSLDTVPTLVVKEVQEIGGSDPARPMLSRIGDLHETDGGLLVVSDQLSRRIYVFGQDGRVVHVIGRPGSGPGEFRSLTHMGVVGDHIWVSDPLNGRLTVFTLQGSIISEVPFRGGEFVSIGRERIRIIPGPPLGQGRYASIVDAPTEGVATADSMRFPALIFDSEGKVADTAGTHFVPPRRGSVLLGRFAVLVPGISQTWPLRFAAGADSLQVARPAPLSSSRATFTVKRWTANGDTALLRFHYEPSRVEGADIISATTALNGELPLVRGELEEAIGEALGAPVFHPPVSDHRAGSDGSVWLRREPLAGTNDRWLLLSSGGLPRGHLILPSQWQILSVSQDHAWVVDTDNAGVPALLRIRF